jgi:hypothetical protein
MLVSLLLPLAATSETPDRHDLRAALDISYLDTKGLSSWTEGSVGKLRYDEDSDGLMLSRAFIDYSLNLADTVTANVALELYDDELGAIADFTEAYLEWRPVPNSENRFRLKLGAFYPNISMENTGASWSSPYTMNASAINTWIGEELRTVGAELSVSRRPEIFGGAHTFSLEGSVFWGNDPAGSLLAWKGWSLHDRQSRFGDKLPLPPLPQIAPGMMFEAQDPYVAPFREVDGRPGYYLSGSWRFSNRMLVRAMHYDNRADPTAIERGQYGWTTRFDHVGLQVTLPADVGLIFQWMRGSTNMGPRVNRAHVVDVEYDSNFVLLTKLVGKHRLSARYDHFEVTQNDHTFEDNNPENGHAWTISYQMAYTEYATLAVEWLRVQTHHCGWVYYGIAPDATERQLQVSLRLRFGN